MPSLNPPQLSARKAYPILRKTKFRTTTFTPQIHTSIQQKNKEGIPLVDSWIATNYAVGLILL